MNKIILSLSFLLILNSCSISQPSDTPVIVTPAAYNLSTYLPLLENKSVGLVVNQTSMINQTHLVDTLLNLNIAVKKVFAPEHGFRGDADAGELVKDGLDSKTNVPIISLYGKNKKPSVENLKHIDVVVFDIQDVGVRFYTYISTMHYMMEACAENNIKFIVLDRPNPNGMFIDGSILDPDFKSFVGLDPIPILHGLTIGELALMINGESWLEGGEECNITVVPVDNYEHQQSYSLPVKPSPNLPNDLSIKLYPSLCLFEGTVISVGRGTHEPFQQIGHPDFKDMPDQFTPKSIDGMAKHPRYEDETCYGISFKDMKTTPQGLNLHYLIDFYQKYKGDDFFTSYFNTLAGTDALRKQIEQGLSEKEIKESWQPGLKQYQQIRKKYLLYPDFK